MNAAKPRSGSKNTLRAIITVTCVTVLGLEYYRVFGGPQRATEQVKSPPIAKVSTEEPDSDLQDKAESVEGDKVTPKNPSADMTQRDARQAFIHNIEEQLASEGRDVEWSRTTEANIRSFFEHAPGLKLQIGEILCGRSVCRTQLQHHSQEFISPSLWIRLTLERGHLTRMKMHFASSTPGKTTIYFRRENTANIR